MFFFGNWCWVNGFVFGVDFYKINFFLDKDFNCFGFGYFENYIDVSIFYFVLFIVIWYDQLFNEKNGFWVQLGFQVSYFVRSYVGLGVGVFFNGGLNE